MTRILATAAVLLLVATFSSGQAPSTGPDPAQQEALEREIGELLSQRARARWPDDSAFIERTIGETHVSVREAGDVRRLTKAQVMARAPRFFAPLPDEIGFTQSVEDVTVQRYGDIAVVQYRLDSRMVFNEEPVRKQRRCTEVFNRESGQWQSVAYHETVIPDTIVPVPVDPAIYDEYVGRYKLFTDYVYTVTREADKLLFSSPAGGTEELMPETQSSFVLRGSLYRVIFIRNERGEISHLRLREFPGVEYNAIRVG